MTQQLLRLPLLLAIAFLANCVGSEGSSDAERTPLSKADTVGSCQGACGGKSADACWCDDQCANYGDCCTDKVEVCDAPEPTACGGWLGDTCAADEFCSFTPNAICGFADASGVCQTRPELNECNSDFSPVCGCSGKTYINECNANLDGSSVHTQGLCPDIAPTCGGFANTLCPAGMECVDDPSDSCDPANNGADCGGICVEPQGCAPVLCNLNCEFGFMTDGQGCEICQCNLPPGPTDSCEDSCGEKSNSGSCYCDDSCVQYGDCCGDIDLFCTGPERVPASGMCVKNSNDECSTDDDCNAGGCGGELCFNPNISSGISTCECTTPTQVSGCGCVAGSCTWYNE